MAAPTYVLGDLSSDNYTLTAMGLKLSRGPLSSGPHPSTTTTPAHPALEKGLRPLFACSRDGRALGLEEEVWT